MNNRRLLIAAVFHFRHPVDSKTVKDSKKHHKLTKNSVNSASAVKVNKIQDAE